MAADLDRAACTAAAGGPDWRHVHPGGLCRHPVAGGQPAWWRAFEGPAGRANPLGQHDPITVAGRRVYATVDSTVAGMGAAGWGVSVLTHVWPCGPGPG